MLVVNNTDEYIEKAGIKNCSDEQRNILNKILHYEYMNANESMTRLHSHSMHIKSLLVCLRYWYIKYAKFGTYIHFNNLQTHKGFYTKHINL